MSTCAMAHSLKSWCKRIKLAHWRGNNVFDYQGDNQRPSLSPHQVLAHCVSSKRSMSYLHSSFFPLYVERPSPVVHLDIKPAFVHLDRDMAAEVADVGSSRMIASRLSYWKLSIVVGSEFYCDPCLMEENRASRACDMFSLGQVICEILAGKSPWGSRGKEYCSLGKN